MENTTELNMNELDFNEQDEYIMGLAELEDKRNWYIPVYEEEQCYG